MTIPHQLHVAALADWLRRKYGDGWVSVSASTRETTLHAFERGVARFVSIRREWLDK
jgi:hypothetical protein